ncbi:type II toxin-antitoxin system HipA family toxin [Ruania zhangjianzhongii]|uniref:type II toxin-antitoxin system HipA family toxin n=1 Tax=Ruania zhangjianzhongii TaxID=2603206 RepID=UPI0011C8812A|nr:type II toxin-antitoxin system HipA family toxin [Ruania zhangjianzhongii]
MDSHAWRRFADDAGLDAERVLVRVVAMAEAVPAAFEAALAEVDDWHGQAADLSERLLPRLRRRAARLA